MKETHFSIVPMCRPLNNDGRTIHDAMAIGYYAIDTIVRCYQATDRVAHGYKATDIMSDGYDASTRDMPNQDNIVMQVWLILMAHLFICILHYNQ